MSEPEFNSYTEQEWHDILYGVHPALRRGRHLFGLLPSNPRCKSCNAPFGGVGGFLMRLIGKGPFEKNPNFCKTCLTDNEVTGIEIEISMLFADVRGSTTLAEEMSPSRFTDLMNKFFDVAMSALVRTDAWIDRMIGDEVVGLYIPGFAGPQHALRAVEAAQQLLRATGHADRDGPWLPIGVGVHTGPAYVGMVGSEGGVSDVTAMGDAMNITARLTSLAGPGEALVSEATCTAAGLDVGDLEHRHLDLKGRAEPVDVCVLRVAPTQAANFG